MVKSMKSALTRFDMKNTQQKSLIRKNAASLICVVAVVRFLKNDNVVHTMTTNYVFALNGK